MNSQSNASCNTTDGRQSPYHLSVTVTNISKDCKQSLNHLTVKSISKDDLEDSEYETGSSGSGSLVPWQGSLECLGTDQDSLDLQGSGQEEEKVQENLFIDILPKDTMLDRVLRCFEALHVFRNRDNLMANLRDQVVDLNKDYMFSSNSNSSYEKSHKQPANFEYLDSTDNWPPHLFFRDFSLEEKQFPVSEGGSVCSAADHKKFFNSSHCSSYDFLSTSESCDNIQTVKENIQIEENENFNGFIENILTPPGKFRSNNESEESVSPFCLITESEFKKKYGGDLNVAALGENNFDKILEKPCSSTENSLSNLEHLNRAGYFKNVLNDSIQSLENKNYESHDMNSLNIISLPTEESNLVPLNTTSITEKCLNEKHFSDVAKGNTEYNLDGGKENCLLSMSSIPSSSLPSIPPPVNFDTHPFYMNMVEKDSLESENINMSSSSSISNIMTIEKCESTGESPNKLDQKVLYDTDTLQNINSSLHDYSNNVSVDSNQNKKNVNNESVNKTSLINDPLNENSLSSGSFSENSPCNDSLNKTSINSLSSNKNSLSITNLSSDNYMMSKVISFSEISYPSLQVNKKKLNNFVQSKSFQSQKMYPESDIDSESDDKHSDQNSLNSINNEEVLETLIIKTDDSFKVEMNIGNIEHSNVANVDSNHFEEFANESSKTKIENTDEIYKEEDEKNNSLTLPKLENIEIMKNEKTSTGLTSVIGNFKNRILIDKTCENDTHIDDDDINVFNDSKSDERNVSAKINVTVLNNHVQSTIGKSEEISIESEHENNIKNCTYKKSNIVQTNIEENINSCKSSLSNPNSQTLKLPSKPLLTPPNMLASSSQTWRLPSKPLVTSPNTQCKPFTSSCYLNRDQLTPVQEEDDTPADEVDDLVLWTTDDPVLSMDEDSMFVEKHFHFRDSSNSSNNSFDECPSEPSYKSFLDTGLEPFANHVHSEAKPNNTVTLEGREPYSSHFQDDWSMGCESQLCTELRNLEPEHFVKLLPQLIQNEHMHTQSKTLHTCVLFLCCFPEMLLIGFVLRNNPMHTLSKVFRFL
ncbi:unnamed protein product [Meganyctiphanes norvegica]|uniref:Uncharacterized protein n=1 Tax=Meganyctiphanes norvegica TaxID=48144 RepID=A0AAV2QQ90_MEGNR